MRDNPHLIARSLEGLIPNWASFGDRRSKRLNAGQREVAAVSPWRSAHAAARRTTPIAPYANPAGRGKGIIVAHAQDFHQGPRPGFGFQQEMQTHGIGSWEYVMRTSVTTAGLAECACSKEIVVAGTAPGGLGWLLHNAGSPADCCFLG
jgi:hypothetical protein